jgi:hypothetical protein
VQSLVPAIVLFSILIALLPIIKITAITVQTKSGGQHHAGLLPITKITAITLQTKKRWSTSCCPPAHHKNHSHHSSDKKMVVNVMLPSYPSQKSQPSPFRQKSGDQHHAGLLPIIKITAITLQTKEHCSTSCCPPTHHKNHNHHPSDKKWWSTSRWPPAHHKNHSHHSSDKKVVVNITLPSCPS